MTNEECADNALDATASRAYKAMIEARAKG